jgi:hypothetical protein
MKEAIGRRVGVFRTTMRRAVFRMPILFALVAPVVGVLTKRGSVTYTSNMTVALLAAAVGCCLTLASLWLITLIWKVTLFEGGVRGPTHSFGSLTPGLRTLAWGEIRSAERIPSPLKSITPFHAVLWIRPSRGPAISINEPLVGMQEFKEHVRRLAGEDHPLARLLHER